MGDQKCDAACDDAYTKLSSMGEEIIYDDREARAGTKFADMDLIGVPWQIVIGPRGLGSGVVEMKHRGTGERYELSLDSAMTKLLS